MHELYEHLYTILYQLFKYYFGVIAIPLSLFLALTREINSITWDLYNLPVPFVYIVLFLVVIGVIFLAIIMNLRMRMIFYAKSANLTRKYFTDNSLEDDLTKYLKLPITDEEPKHFEGFLHHFPILVFLMAFLNGTLLAIGLLSLTKNLFLTIMFAILLFLIQFDFYVRCTSYKDKATLKKR